jgi:Dyp-type peroxidase family
VPAPRDEIGDVQALLRSGFGSLGAARFILLQFGDREAGASWLRGIGVASVDDAQARRLEEVVQVAFTARGLRALGWREHDLEAFAPEFLDGLAGSERRSHRLGDTGANAPEHWQWGSGSREPDVLIMLLSHRAAVDERAAAIEEGARASGLVVLESLASCPSREDGGPAVEPFGFADGLSQPEIDWDGSVAVKGALNRQYRNRIAAGEFVLGHINEYDFVTDYPEEPAIGRNGSYLVYRQLEQDVVGFWRWAASQGGSVEGGVALAERMVGRRRDGRALAGLAGHDEFDFLFDADPAGVHCPIASHIRRSNPRSSDDPNGRRGFVRDLISSLGLNGRAEDDTVASSRFHRLLRRGRPYGALITPEQAIDRDVPLEPTGLHFLCLNASLARQFEFVQAAWIASASFGGRAGEQDPLLGNRAPLADGSSPDRFRYIDERGEPRICSGLPRFVTVRGGAYFFLPGVRGLAAILGG